MIKKKKAVKSKPLKDFEIVAHVIPVQSRRKFSHCGDTYIFQALYINRYGLEIGALVKDVKTGKLNSWDPGIWDEYLEMQWCDAQAKASSGGNT